MRVSRSSFFLVLVVALGACSGNFGAGSTPPVGASPFGLAPTATPSPTSASAILTYGESTAFQTIPDVGGYAAAVAFPKQPPPTPNPKATASASEPVSIGATLWTTKPDDGPDLNLASGKGRKARKRELPARALAYVVLLPTHDATLPAYPRLALDVPREVAAQYRDGEFGLALWNSGEKDATYRLAVAERETGTPPPIARPSGAPQSVPAGVATPSSSASLSPGASPAASRAPASAPSAMATLPPQRIVFLATERPLKLLANRPAVFALYALPKPSATPRASSSPAASASPGSASPVPSPSAVPTGSASPKS